MIPWFWGAVDMPERPPLVFGRRYRCRRCDVYGTTTAKLGERPDCWCCDRHDSTEFTC